MKTIALESKTFSSEQRNWDTCDREYFGFVWAVNKFRTFLEGAFSKRSQTTPRSCRYSLASILKAQSRLAGR